MRAVTLWLLGVDVYFATLLLARVITCEGRHRDKGTLRQKDHFWVSNSSELTLLLAFVFDLHL